MGFPQGLDRWTAFSEQVRQVATAAGISVEERPHAFTRRHSGSSTENAVCVRS